VDPGRVAAKSCESQRAQKESYCAFADEGCGVSFDRPVMAPEAAIWASLSLVAR
jgi:hypothetical protein